MEDFASVIWAVIIVGAMIFNVVSQSRKARGKGARQTPHGEAWPTSAPDMPMPSATPARPEPAAPVFEDECRSLKEIPAQEYEPEYTAPKTAETKAPRHQTAERFKTAPEKDAIAAHARGGGHRRRIRPAAGRDLLGDTETPFRRGIGRLGPREPTSNPAAASERPQSANTFLNSIRRWQPFFHASLRGRFPPTK